MSTNKCKKKNFRSNSLSKAKRLPSLSPKKPSISRICSKALVSSCSGIQSLNSDTNKAEITIPRCLEILDKLIAAQRPIQGELRYIKDVFEACSERRCVEKRQTLGVDLEMEMQTRSQSEFEDNEREYDNNNKLHRGSVRQKFSRSRTIFHLNGLMQKISSSDSQCFQDEFMSKADEFSESWRVLLKDHKT